MKKDKHYEDFAVKLSHGTYLIVQQDALGLFLPQKSIVINKSKPDKKKGWSKERNLLDTFIHEVIHQSQNWKSEKEVAATANDIQTVLWKAGYRRLPNKVTKARNKLKKIQKRLKTFKP